jgi:hypothetical protein
MTKRSITFAILTALTAVLSACSSATAPGQDQAARTNTGTMAATRCQPGVSAGSGTC